MKKYVNLKAAIILYNIFSAFLMLILTVATIYRYTKGIYQPWFYQFIISDKSVFDAVYSVNSSLTLTYFDFSKVVYVMAPLYLAIMHIYNTFVVILSTAFKNSKVLERSSRVSLVINL